MLFRFEISGICQVNIHFDGCQSVLRFKLDVISWSNMTRQGSTPGVCFLILTATLWIMFAIGVITL